MEPFEMPANDASLRSGPSQRRQPTAANSDKTAAPPMATITTDDRPSAGGPRCRLRRTKCSRPGDGLDRMDPCHGSAGHVRALRSAGVIAMLLYRPFRRRSMESEFPTSPCDREGWSMAWRLCSVWTRSAPAPGAVGGRAMALSVPDRISGPLVTPKAKVTPARISSSGAARQATGSG